MSPRVSKEKNMRIWSLVNLAAAAMLVLGAAGVATAQTNERVPADAATTGQKAKFVENLATRSVSAKTIENSGDAAAIAKLDQARTLITEANGLISDGQYDGADQKLDQALALINAETRRLSKSDVNEARAQEGYQKRLHAVETFLTAYERVSSDQGSSAANKAQAAEIKRLIGQARGLAGEGDYETAQTILEDAYQIARGDIRTLRQGQTLKRSLDFATVEEEYNYERGRNDSHFMLLKFAMSEKKPAASMLGRITQYEGDAQSIRDQAEQNAASGDFDGAIQDLNESTNTLLKAIRMSGIFVPG